VYSDGAVPYVSFADAMWLGYPLSYVGLVLLVRSRARHLHRSTWLDGLVAGLAAAAFSAAIAYDVLMSHAGGRPLVVAVNLAYPIADLLLITTVVCVFGSACAPSAATTPRASWSAGRCRRTTSTPGSRAAASSARSPRSATRAAPVAA
jgi:hypothetical protein